MDDLLKILYENREDSPFWTPASESTEVDLYSRRLQALDDLKGCLTREQLALLEQYMKANESMDELFYKKDFVSGFYMGLTYPDEQQAQRSRPNRENSKRKGARGKK